MKHAYKIRIGTIFIILLFAYTIIIFNLYVIQLYNHAFFTSLATKQYNLTLTKNPPRAAIFDRAGDNYLAMNKDSVSAFIIPNKLIHYDAVAQFLQEHFPAAYDRLLAHRDKPFLYIKRKLSPEQIELIQQCSISDIHLLHEPNRFYPLECAAPLIGVTDIDNHGLLGIELLYDAHLAGSASTVSLEKDARSGHFYFKKETTVQGRESQSLTLSIDSDLQFLAYEELQRAVHAFNAQEGAVIIMDPTNGEIITMASYPSFNPNERDNLELAHTKNRCVTETYELGSVIKIFAALAALDEELITLSEVINCKNTKTAYIDGRKINTWKAHGEIPFIDVIAQSNNIGTAIVAKRLGSKLYDHYKRVGFGTKTGIEFPGEQKGFINPPTSWSLQSIISLSYGYEITATLLQLARAFAIIANDGHDITPTLLRKNTPNTPHPQTLYSDHAIQDIKHVLEQTTLQGTTKRAAIKGYRVMSKTGTANLLVDGVYQPDKNIYTCAGIIEKDDYKRVIVTFIKEADKKDLYASLVAAPLFERIAQKVLIHDAIIS